VKKIVERIVFLFGIAGVYASMTAADGKSGHSCIFDMDVSSCNSAGY